MATDPTGPRRRGRRKRSRESRIITIMLGLVIAANIIFGTIMGVLIWRAYQ